MTCQSLQKPFDFRNHMPARGRGLLVWAAPFLTVLILASGANALPFSNLIVFGDSIVDQGNTQALVVGAFGPGADPAPASAGYFVG